MRVRAELIKHRWYNGTSFFEAPDGLSRAGDPSGTG